MTSTSKAIITTSLLLIGIIMTASKNKLKGIFLILIGAILSLLFGKLESSEFKLSDRFKNLTKKEFMIAIEQIDAARYGIELNQEGFITVPFLE